MLWTEIRIKSPIKLEIERGNEVENKRGDGIRVKSVTRIRIKSEIEIEIDIDRYKRRKNSFYVHVGEAAGINCMGPTHPQEKAEQGLPG
ncbi:hypothetical protein EVAR_62074_1 [Eumeta japonica]|uniref:Uncharacterized protein n=1 Tax=Eumeta variegata TaxID=151549 RepID=A0A4C1Z4L2_EUMVA|nr:hypothetical protein EVAR_62074_1 [Eumeta japonica]